jgi:hypothetical protein
MEYDKEYHKAYYRKNREKIIKKSLRHYIKKRGIKKCKLCQNKIPYGKSLQKYCSKRCSHKADSKRKKEWNINNYQKNKDKINQQKRERRKRPEIKQKEKEYSRKYYARPEVKERTKKYLAIPEVKERRKELGRQYQQNPLAKEKVRIYLAIPEVKEKRRENARQYNQRRKVKIQHKKYCNFEIITPSIKKIKQKLPLIKRLYLKENHSATSIAKKLKTSPNLIIGLLRKNNIPIKPKIFCNKRAIPCSNGLLVKSNSERAIVEILLQRNIPFVYEPHLQNIRFVPDFFLPVQDLFVEFAGLTDKKWYNEQLAKKKEVYTEINLNAIFITKPEQIIEAII